MNDVSSWKYFTAEHRVHRAGCTEGDADSSRPPGQIRPLCPSPTGKWKEVKLHLDSQGKLARGNADS